MVGRLWTAPEEKYFWKKVVPHSSKRVGIDRVNKPKEWEELAHQMQRDMDLQGTSQRTYTGTMLFEHYFQNIDAGRPSPSGVYYVNEYLDKLGPDREYVNPRTNRRRRKEAIRGKARAVSTEPAPPSDRMKDDSVAAGPADRRGSDADSHPPSKVSSGFLGRRPKGFSRESRRLRPLAPAPSPILTSQPVADRDRESPSLTKPKAASGPQGMGLPPITPISASLPRQQKSLDSAVGVASPALTSWGSQSEAYPTPREGQFPRSPNLYSNDSGWQRDYSGGYQTGRASIPSSPYTPSFSPYLPVNNGRAYSGNHSRDAWAPQSQQYYPNDYSYGYRPVTQSSPVVESFPMQFTTSNGPSGGTYNGNSQYSPQYNPSYNSSYNSPYPQYGSFPTSDVGRGTVPVRQSLPNPSLLADPMLPPPSQFDNPAGEEEESLFVQDGDPSVADTRAHAVNETTMTQGTTNHPTTQYGIDDVVNRNDGSNDRAYLNDNELFPGLDLNF
ncbi:uncharacterized protein F4822DRAFT_426655 [Hypoxylon trugodes]|uniref:uncharacterized protein n=1 Tax=Hypoxylon trugodes TaxID=326681 RepID=UPI0021957444|nr:uncharacterized protein F4822DRAFT_426655 [Hypoxylon trugodes]KAI1390808.1 hypothetical protein F4822DRAFT_426655 [Hypoxylon trugodes]